MKADDPHAYEATINGACAKRFNFVCSAKREVFKVSKCQCDSCNDRD